MIVYLDASAVVATLSRQPSSALVDKILKEDASEILASDFALAETSAALAKLGRVEAWSPDQASLVFNDLDLWTDQIAERIVVVPRDIADAERFVRTEGIVLRAPDAIHIAATHRLGATLLTLDKGMARAAAALGVPHLNPAEVDAPGIPKD